MSETKKGKPKSEEHKKKLKEAWKNRRLKKVDKNYIMWYK